MTGWIRRNTWDSLKNQPGSGKGGWRVQRTRALRPTGEQINDFLIPTQVKTLNEGLGESKDGLTQIQNGLSEAGKRSARIRRS